MGTIECPMTNELSEHVFNVLGPRKRGCDSVMMLETRSASSRLSSSASGHSGALREDWFKRSGVRSRIESTEKGEEGMRDVERWSYGKRPISGGDELNPRRHIVPAHLWTLR
jgi:hypothetical protein